MQFLGAFTRSILLLLAVTATPAWADSVLHDWADASNQEYREIKKLGTDVTPEQIRGIRRRCYEPVMAKAAGEGIEIFRKERGKLDSALLDVRAAMFPHLYPNGPKKGPTPGGGQGQMAGDNQGMGGGGVGGGGGGMGAGGNPAASERAQGTGATEGGAGGKDVTFGGKRDKKKESVNVDSDGIIH
jgi:hypothetical protein